MVSFFKKKPEEEPLLPLGLRIGAPVEFGEFAFFDADAAFTDNDSDGMEALVERLEIMDMGDDGKVVWAYLSDRGAMLHVYADAKGEIEELRLYRTVHTETPSSEEEWNFWEQELIGFIRFQMSEQVMPEAPIYERMWQQDGAEHIDAMAFEMKAQSKADGPKVTLTHKVMRYARVVGVYATQRNEWLDIVVAENESAAWIDLRVGYDLNPADVTVL